MTERAMTERARTPSRSVPHPAASRTAGAGGISEPEDPRVTIGRSALLWRWVTWTTVGEVLGFTVPALAGALTASWAGQWAVLVLVGAGAVEGTALGWAQARALLPVLPALRTRRFVLGTAVAAAFAYLLGMLPSALGERLTELPVTVLVLGGLVAGLLLLASIGTAQWLELRHHLPRSGSWVVVTGCAWTLGLVAFSAVAMPLWQEGQSLPVLVAIGVLGAVVMASTVALVTGAGMVRLLTGAGLVGSATEGG